jgi:hypothetical protein
MSLDDIGISFRYYFSLRIHCHRLTQLRAGSPLAPEREHRSYLLLRVEAPTLNPGRVQMVYILFRIADKFFLASSTVAVKEHADL